MNEIWYTLDEKMPVDGESIIVRWTSGEETSVIWTPEGINWGNISCWRQWTIEEVLRREG